MTFFLHQRQACRFAAVFLMLAIELEAFGPMAEERRINALPTDPGADIFAASAPVLRFKIEIGETNLQSLRKEPRKYVPATVREGGLIYTNVGVHLKGAAGSFRSIDDKAALTLSFGKLSPRQRFHGLQKIHLNNSVQDPSFSTEYVCGGLFHAAGVPAPRVTNARVWMNGRDLGFYVLIEGFTGDFLGRYFKNTKGNLYDGGFLKDVTDSLDKESGIDNKDESDLKALADAAQEPEPTERWERLNKTLDVDRFISFAAMEVLVWDWDGYVMNRNNYRVYHDPARGKMVFMPHGMDQMFWDANGSIRPDFNGLVARALIQTPEGNRLYRQRLEELLHTVYRPDALTNLVARLHARNRSAVAELGANAARNYDNAIAEVRDRIIGRWRGVKEQLESEPRPLRFVASVAKLADWHVQRDAAAARLDRVDDHGKATLHIAALGNCTASWRAKVQLERGRYRFEGFARCARVMPTRDDQKGEGVGLRISGTTRPRANKLMGDAPWRKLDFEFEISPALESVELVCELRATQGEAWFDTDSLVLVRLK